MPKDTIHPKILHQEGVLESPRQLSVRNHYEVVVCGGGPAGVGAALAAAREGARTLVIEQYGMLGGVWTAGLLNPFFECGGRGWVVDDLVSRLTREGAFRKWRAHDYCFDVEVMRRTLEQMLSEAGADLLYYTRIADSIVIDDKICGVVIESKAGRQAVMAEVVIDTTGDGDVLARSGCEYQLGRESDGQLQPMTLMFEVRGLPHDYEQESSQVLYDQMMHAIKTHQLDYELPYPRCGYAPWIVSTPSPGIGDVQCTHVFRMNPLDPGDLTRGTVDCRQQAADTVEILKCIPGFEQVELSQTASQIGIREARRLVGHYSMERQDLIDGRRFDDAVTSCGFVIDVHHQEASGKEVEMVHTRIKPYEIPYRCLLPRDLRGLLVAGRCISGSHEAHASYRVTGTAMALGQAAGLAAAQALRQKIELDAVDGKQLRAILKKRGAKFADEVAVLHQ
ncbi:FAD-dependent oxidoreductase [Kiritimatiellaeota bacterium B1221]|nr:FAD-dependent oxidoreductase [Kiritimatiellaeota bacterium B1221]